jgi:hypothetical protein
MNFQSIHKKVTYICLALFPVSFIIGGITEIPNSTERAANYLFFVGAIFMISYCLNGIERGKIELLSYTDKLDKKKEPVLFWLFVSGILVCTVVAAPVFLYRVFA